MATNSESFPLKTPMSDAEGDKYGSILAHFCNKLPEYAAKHGDRMALVMMVGEAYAAGFQEGKMFERFHPLERHNVFG